MGADNVIHTLWPDYYTLEQEQKQEQMTQTLSAIASDLTIKALIINHAIPGTNAAVDVLRKTRQDMFVVYCTPQVDTFDISKNVDLILAPDELGMGYTMPTQAVILGAKVFVHYSFPRHMAQAVFSGRREILKSECARLGLEFINANTMDTISGVGVAGAQQAIMEDVPKKIAEYGKDTAFFVTSCGLQPGLIKAVVDGGAIYPQPCCPSPFHGFPTALGIEGGVLDIDRVIAETRSILKEKGMSGRLSTWPISVSMTETYTGVEYAIRWINGDVPKDGLDLETLKACMEEYTGVDVSFTSYEENGVTFDNFQMFLMDYLTY